MATEFGTWSCEEALRIIPCLWVEHLSSLEMHSQFVEVYYDDSVVGVQHVRKLRRKF
jgi:hypothetical protein